jgi:hypothetical protein
MSDYIPTTEEVREQFSCIGRAIEAATELRGGSNFKKTDEVWTKYFDRWLADVKAEVWYEGYNAGKPYPMLVTKNPYWKEEE